MVLHTMLCMEQEVFMAKKIMKGILTILFLVLINLGLSHLTNSHFIDYMFFVGLAITVIIVFFSSSGGFTTEYTDVVTNKTNKVLNKEEEKGFKFKLNVYFLVSLLYTIIGFIAGIYLYRSYF